MPAERSAPPPLPLRLMALFAYVASAATCGDTRDLPGLITTRPRPLIFAHRGGGGEAPESTLPTFLALAARDPAAVIEFDVHRTRTGELVVLHDDTVDRTTNGTGAVETLDLATVQSLDAGYCFRPDDDDGTPTTEECRQGDPASFPFRGKGYKIPLLSEVLMALSEVPGAVIGIELKSFGVSRAVAATLIAWPADRLVLGSADDETSRELRRLIPRATHYVPETAGTCHVIGSWSGSNNPSCPAYDILAIPVSAGPLRFDSRRIIEQAHERGMAVVYWTINTEEEITRLIKLGADGIITDQPARARTIVEGLRARGELP